MDYKILPKLTLFYLLCHLLFTGCGNTKQLVDNEKLVGSEKDYYRFAFYNVENLFDTLDHPVKRDEEFTPGSKKQWTSERYNTKLDRIRQVINALDNPIAMGLCEVENEKVLQDLVGKNSFGNHKYDIVHYESPDARGIDVAFIYQSGYLKILNHRKITIDFPSEVVEDYTTRDILHVKAETPEQEIIHFFVNHWPSRYGGVEKSEPKRLFVAEQLKKEINKIQKENPTEGIVMLGDFNDGPTNNSITKVLEAENNKNSEIFCCHCELAASGEGSHSYRGEWNMLDQFFVTKNLMDNGKIQYLNAGVLKEKYLFFNHPKNGKTPTRTYSGKKYYAGYSDHLPVYIDLKKNKY